MEGSSVTDLKLHENELCGLWKDRVGGEAAIRGTYTSAAVDLLIKAITAAKAPLTFRKEKFILGPGNHVRN